MNSGRIFCIRINEFASRELMLAQEQMLLLGRRTAEEKVASFLVGWRERLAHIGDDRQTIALPMSRQDIADYLGLTIETVSRTLTRFEREKMLIIVAGGVRLLDRDPGRSHGGGVKIPAQPRSKLIQVKARMKARGHASSITGGQSHANRFVDCFRLRRRDVRGLRRGAGLG